MSEETTAEKLCSDLAETAGILGVPFHRRRVWPILETYRRTFADSGIAFSVHVGEDDVKELNFAFAVPSEIGDPYGHALSRGFVTAADHPAHTLLAEVRARCEVAEHFVDCGVRGGFRKLYAHFPHDLRSLSDIAALPSMPKSVTENADLFARHGLEHVAMVGINYRDEAVSLYFQFGADGHPSVATVRALLHEIGLAEPDERLLEFAHRSLRANITLGWDSPRITRVALAPPPRRGLRVSALPTRLEPHIERFATSAPRTYTGERVNLFAVKWTAEREFLEVCSYYQLSVLQQKLFLNGR
ncbi:hypothetical protein LO762_03095 [Actinocorallia sp. API 0066]|uniref:aromatic prenyltransferase n=1 Tax=Actinocorallia sp. API 0066 TaxID=2896846 RepID=UPI001E353A92|nr:aromatic prenyltransferase [Actinocorallia sp. API 0066]MCD0448188.1 hypothetical protein [Actinocorallia sp. API 0066]